MLHCSMKLSTVLLVALVTITILPKKVFGQTKEHEEEHATDETKHEEKDDFSVSASIKSRVFNNNC